MLELNLSKQWADAILQRSSVRHYTAAPDDAQLARLGQLARKLSWQGVTLRLFQGPGLRNAIRGTNVYAVIVAKKGTPGEHEGYMGEALVLEATSMGLGTCWLGSGYNRDIIQRNVNLQPDEAVHCVIAIGQCPLPSYAPKRRPIEKTCGRDEAALAALGAWQLPAVRAACAAPSALNLQPWKITANSSSITFVDNALFLKQFAHISCGIAMLHAAVSASASGRTPLWRRSEEGYVLTA